MTTKISNKGKASTPPSLPSEKRGSFSPSPRGSQTGSSSAFTLIELLIVIAIIAILSIVVVLTLSPGEMLRQARDQNRLSDMDTLTHALSLYQTDRATQGGALALGNASTVYISLPDPSLSGNTTSTCASLGLPLLPAGFLYQCASPQSYRDSDGTGWIPINLASTTTGNPLSALPKDPQNTSSSRLYYTYTTNGSQYELTTSLESQKYKLGGTNDVVSSDGGTLATVYEKGSKLGLEPLDYGDPNLVGYWTFDEGSGTTVNDWSGMSNNGTFTSGSPVWLVSCKIGLSCLNFSAATTQQITVPATSSLSISNALTISFWFYPVTSTAGYAGQLITKWNASTTDTNYAIYWFGATSGTNGQLALYATVGGSWRGVVLNTPLLNNWHHIVFTFTSGAQAMYVDNILVSNGTYTGNLATNAANLMIGKNTNDASYYLDNVRIYNRALSASEIASLYNGGK